MDKTLKRNLNILMGDINTKMGADNTNRNLIMDRQGTGEQNENGELFTDFCTFNDLGIGGTIFPHKNIHKTTWIFLTARLKTKSITLPSDESGKEA